MQNVKGNYLLSSKEPFMIVYKKAGANEFSFTINNMQKDATIAVLEEIKFMVLSGKIKFVPQAELEAERSAEEVIEKLIKESGSNGP